ncbi:MAG: hypothetical protein Ct9H300mP3_09290 [Gammaproteobacteria bacterium]|nr:MAG: hypothetical protein Ct9H300mP3_09290 [Gammaproteobacteria bacterium]
MSGIWALERGKGLPLEILLDGVTFFKEISLSNAFAYFLSISPFKGDKHKVSVS